MTAVEAGIAQRRRLGLDRYDEVWEGTYHVAPAPRFAHGYVGRQLAVLLAPFAAAAGLVGTYAFNLGTPEDYRVPDGGYHRGQLDATFLPTAAVVVEVVSPGDETFDKFDFYARHGVDEVLVADPTARSIRCWQLSGPDRYAESTRSSLLDVGTAELARRIDWPAG